MSEPKARCVMVQGTMSGVGKSLLCAGLCRIFAREGLRVAPFKSQNMALNSYITAQGLEMGRAQVMQAQAAGREPDVRMNPILLKPTGDAGSQLVLNGEVAGNYSAREYFALKKSLIPHILQAYNSLAAQNDLIVIEGAGSPAEINLRADDIVNMGLAELVNAPVLLAGDIDRGGVFAQLYGTMALLQPAEKARVKGLIINKFRGDPELLRPGLEPLEALCQKPVLGIVPYLPLTLDDEDSLAPGLEQRDATGAVDVAVIRLPHISNFTDLTPLALQPGVGVRYVTGPRGLGQPHLIIVPGTKNTLEDLRWLRSGGLEQEILRLAGQDVPVLGICGGYQMLGQSIADPDGVETGGEERGLGLLPCTTRLTAQKVRTRVQGRAGRLPGPWQPLSGAEFGGYEIHMGRTERAGADPFAELTAEDGTTVWDGCVRGNVAGTYCHGLFEQGTLAPRLANLLGGGGPVAGWDYRAYRETQYDALADGLRGALDMEKIYHILEGNA